MKVLMRLHANSINVSMIDSGAKNCHNNYFFDLAYVAEVLKKFGIKYSNSSQ